MLAAAKGNTMIWNLIAKLITRPAVANWLIERAKRTYLGLDSQEGGAA